MKTYTCVVLLLCLASVGALKFPPYITRCSRSDPKMNECALKSARAVLPMLVKGDPKYKIMSIDPAIIEKISFGDNSDKPVGIGFVLNNCKIYGLGTIDFTNMRIDLKKHHVEVEGIIHKMIVVGKYKVKGQVLVLPITGDGDANFTVSDINFLSKVDYELYKKKDNKDYFRVKDSRIQSKISHLHIDLTNLFNGDEALGNNMIILLNENWQEMAKIFRPVVEQAIADIIANLLNNILKDIPYNDIFLP